MNRTRATAVVALVGVLLFVGGGVANANPPGLDPLAGWPEPLRPLGVAIFGSLGDVWNFFAGIADLIMFGS